MQRFSFGTQQPDKDARGEFVRLDDVRKLVRSIINDASECTSAGQLLVSEWIVDAACEAVGIRREQ